MRILILNGPNLDMLGIREPKIYGHKSQKQILKEVQGFASEFFADEDLKIDLQQSNNEGRLIDLLHQANENYDGVLFNPAAYTHTSIALSDAIRSIDVPVVEVHLSNVFSRESYRQQMITTGSCAGQVCGFGTDSYVIGLIALRRQIELKQKGK